MAAGKPRTSSSLGRHEYKHEDSLSYWKRQWKAQIDAQAPKTRRETIQRARRLMRETHYRSALHDLAVCYEPKDGDGDECMDD